MMPADRHELAVVGRRRGRRCRACSARGARPPPRGADGPTRTGRASPSRTGGAPACRTPLPQDGLVDLPDLRVSAEQRELPGGLGLALGDDRAGHLVLSDEQAPAAGSRASRTRRRGSSDSSTRFVRTDGSTFRQKSEKDSNRPFAARASMICCTAPSPTLRTAESPYRIARPPLGGRGEVEGGVVHVRRQHLDVHRAAGVQVVGLAVLVVLHRREDRGHVRDRVMRHQVGGLVGDEAVRARVRRVEPVVGERHEHLEHVRGASLGVAALDGALRRTAP